MLLAVIADTHVGDREKSLPDSVLTTLQASQPQQIFHAGDIVAPQVLQQLAQVAPTVAVQGNVDFLHWRNWRLPLARSFEIEGLRIGLTHGHGGWGQYLYEKWVYLRGGPMALPIEFYLTRLPRLFATEMDVVIFGHTHRPFRRKIGNTLYFNPGSVGRAHGFEHIPQIGFLHLERGQVRTEWTRV